MRSRKSWPTKKTAHSLQARSAVVDARTNTIFVPGYADAPEEVRKLLRKIDVPVRQVMIRIAYRGSDRHVPAQPRRAAGYHDKTRPIPRNQGKLPRVPEQRHSHDRRRSLADTASTPVRTSSSRPSRATRWASTCRAGHRRITTGTFSFLLFQRQGDALPEFSSSRRCRRMARAKSSPVRASSRRPGEATIEQARKSPKPAGDLERRDFGIVQKSNALAQGQAADQRLMIM